MSDMSAARQNKTTRRNFSRRAGKWRTTHLSLWVKFKQNNVESCGTLRIYTNIQTCINVCVCVPKVLANSRPPSDSSILGTQRRCRMTKGKGQARKPFKPDSDPKKLRKSGCAVSWSVWKCPNWTKICGKSAQRHAQCDAQRDALCASRRNPKYEPKNTKGTLEGQLRWVFRHCCKRLMVIFFSGKILWKCSWSMSLHIPRITRPGFADVESSSCRNTRQIPDTSTSSSDISRWSRHVQAAAQKYQTTEPTAQTSLWRARHLPHLQSTNPSDGPFGDWAASLSIPEHLTRGFLTPNEQVQDEKDQKDHPQVTENKLQQGPSELCPKNDPKKST